MVSKSEPLAEGTVIMADDQFAGRGQQENTWHSQSGLNLTFSIYLRPHFLPVEHQFKLNMAVSIGVITALKDYLNAGLKIKWPNDLYYNNRKLGGILIENTISSGSIKSSIIGIGLNVNQLDFESHLENKACSLIQILHKQVDLIALLGKICHCIEVEYLNLRAAKPKDQQSLYLENLYQFGEISSYKSKNTMFEGRISGVSEEGKLLVFHQGKAHSYGLKEIEFLDNN